MAKLGKRMTKLRAGLPVAPVPVAEALARAKAGAVAKFDEAIEVAVNLGLDTRKSEQAMRGSVALPAGTGKKVRVAVLVQGEAADAVREAGADRVGFEDLLEDIGKGQFDFDVLIAVPEAMARLAQYGRQLGPKGLMPNPKLGTVSAKPDQAVKAAKKGQVSFRADKGGVVHAAIGRASFSAADLERNLLALIDALKKAQPASAKGQFLRSATLSSTMGVGVPVDIGPYR